MKNQPGPWKTIEKHENRPGTMKNQLGTMKNQENPSGTMKNQPGTIIKHKNPTDLQDTA